jgi:O-antigen ligase
VQNTLYTTPKRHISLETQATLFVVLFVAIFILVQLTVGFQLSLFAVAMAVGVVLTLWHPRVGLYASVVLTIFFERFYTLQPLVLGRTLYKLYPIDIVLGAMLVAVAIRILFRQTQIKLRGVDWILIIFLTYITVLFIRDITVVAADANTAFSTWKNYFFYGLLYFAVPLLLRDKKHLFRFVKFFLAGSVGAILSVLIGIVRGEGLWTQFTPLSTNGVRILAMPHAYYFSMALISVVLSLKYIKSLQDKGSRLASILFVSLPFWIIGITGSLMRHLWIGVIFALTVMWFILPKENRNALTSFLRVVFVSVVIAGIVVSYAVALFPYSNVNTEISQIGIAVSDRLLSLGDSGDTSISWRSSVWQEAIDVFSQSMVFGTGFGAKIPVEIDAYREFIEIRNVHNSWLAMLVQIGIVGFGLILTFFRQLIFFVRKYVFDSDFLNSVRYATLGIFVFQCMIFLYQPYLETNLLGMFFWLNLGVMRTLMHIADTAKVARVSYQNSVPENLPVA